MELKPGYKQTEIGVIPQDWRVTNIGSEFSVQLGKMLDAEKNVGVSKPYLGNSAVQWGRIDLNNIGVIKLTPSDLRRFRLLKDDLLVCEGGEVGRAAIWQQPIEECYYQKALHRLRPLNNYNVHFMLYVLQQIATTGLLLNFVTKTSIAHLPKDKFETVPIPLPPLSEQEAIAKALAVTDALIESLDRLITKKRDIKQAVMQQLLTGHTRLPGFSGEWMGKRLEDVAEIRSGGTPSTSRPEFWDGDIPWCTPTDITGLQGHKYLGQTSRTITFLGLKSSSADLIPAHSVVMTSRATIGECAINVVPVATNQGFKNFIPSQDIDVDFLYYLLQTKKQDFVSLCGGSTFLEIGKTQLSVFEIKMPANKHEQKAIVAILSDMDAELAALEQRRDKTRDIKQAMMQELLTGRTRLI